MYIFDAFHQVFVISSTVITLQYPADRRVTFPPSLPPLKKRSEAVIGGNDDIIHIQRKDLGSLVLQSLIIDKVDIFILHVSRPTFILL